MIKKLWRRVKIIANSKSINATITSTKMIFKQRYSLNAVYIDISLFYCFNKSLIRVNLRVDIFNNFLPQCDHVIYAGCLFYKKT